MLRAPADCSVILCLRTFTDDANLIIDDAHMKLVEGCLGTPCKQSPHHPFYALAMGCDPELALANYFAG